MSESGSESGVELGVRLGSEVGVSLRPFLLFIFTYLILFSQSNYSKRKLFKHTGFVYVEMNH